MDLRGFSRGVWLLQGRGSPDPLSPVSSAPSPCPLRVLLLPSVPSELCSPQMRSPAQPCPLWGSGSPRGVHTSWFLSAAPRQLQAVLRCLPRAPHTGSAGCPPNPSANTATPVSAPQWGKKVHKYRNPFIVEVLEYFKPKL